MQSTTHICLIDQSLKDFAGHYYEYAHCLFREAQNRDHEFIALGYHHTSPELAKVMPVFPTFKHEFFHSFSPTKGKIGKSLDTTLANLSFYKDLEYSLRGKAQKNWTLFMPTIGHRQLLGFIHYIRKQSVMESPQVVLLFRRNYFNPQSQTWQDGTNWLRMGFQQVEYLVSQKYCVRIATDSHILAEEYKKLTNLPIEVFPIPHTYYPESTLNELKDRSSLQPLHLIMLGDARTEKGFPIVVEALEKLKIDLCENRLKVTLQCNLTSDDIPTIAAKQKIMQLNLPNVCLIDQSLSTHEYYAKLQEADVVLIPYQKSAYYARTSGIMAEAFALGKPAIVTEGTWMASQLKLGSGLIVEDQDSQDLANKICQLYLDYPRLNYEIKQQKINWQMFHNPSTLYDLLVLNS